MNKSLDEYLSLIRNVCESDDHHLLGSIALQSIASIGGSGPLHNALGCAYNDHAGKPDMAKQHFELALEFEPQNSAYFGNLGISLVALGEYEEAEKAFHDSIELHHANEESHFHLAVAQFHQGKFSAAAATLEKAVELFPSFKNDPKIAAMISEANALSKESS